MDDFKFFLSLCKIYKYKVFIVSHKTVNGHFQPRSILLRDLEKNFLIKNKILNSNKINLSKNQIFFCDNIDNKISKIKELNLDYFIDDLFLVLNHNNFPSKTTKILFNNLPNKKIKKN